VVRMDSEQEAKEDGPVRTLFVTGFPSDVLNREIYNLFRLHTGFKQCVLNNQSKVLVAFAEFDSQENALKCKKLLHGLKFDFGSSMELRLELAKSNSYTKRKRVGTPSPPGANIYAQEFIMPPDKMQLPPEMKLPPGACCTLFIANLGPKTTEEELRLLFTQYKGFRKLKFQANRGGYPVAFVDFFDEVASTSAMFALQGCHLQSPGDPRGLRIEFAKAVMGKPVRERSLLLGPIIPPSSSSSSSSSQSAFSSSNA